MQTKKEAGEAMYGFVECTVRQFMTRTVTTVKRQTTMRELAVLFEKHDFNAFSELSASSISFAPSHSPPVKLCRITMN
jgi:CBS-domain-containing membrane protein